MPEPHRSPKTPHRIEDPIIIVGTFRSASTLVAELLGSREDCHYLWFELSEEISRATGVPFGAPDSDDLRCPPLTSADATDEQAHAVRQLLHDRCERDGVEPGTHLVVKNPHLWHRLGWVRALLPHACLVVTVRDLRPTVASLKVLWQRSLRQHAHMHHLPEDPARCWDYVAPEQSHRFASDRTFPGGNVEVLAEFWLRANRRLAVAVDAGRVTAVVRHERTLADPDRVARQLQRTLGLDLARLHPPEPIEPERQGEWRDRLEPAEHRALERFVARNQEELLAVDARLDGPLVGSVVNGRSSGCLDTA